MTPERRIWERQFTELTRALGAWVTADGDFHYIRADAPASMVDMYRKLLQLGYAKGWLP